MATPAGVTKLGSLLMGVCLPCLKHNASKIRVQHLDYDKILHTYFKKQIILFAYDPNKICKTGDIVLIEKLDKKMSNTIEHKVLNVVYPLGDLTDPVTGKKVVGTEYREKLDFEANFFGKSEHGFNYDSAPPRGSQENVRDFSHREQYKKYNEFEDGDEYKDHPDETFNL